MKYIAYLILTPLFITACASTGGVGSYAAGSDSAYINGHRGRQDAQITDAQAKQYDRQRQQVLAEQQLDAQKQQQSYQSVNNTLQEGQNLLRFGQNVAGMFGR